MSRPPLKDVANLAGVSEPTVSRVLNGRAGVAEATRRRVVAALEGLGYGVPEAPRRMPRNAVGIISGEITNPVFPALTHEVSARLARHGIVSTIGVAATDTGTEEQYVEEFRRVDVDGIVFIAGRHSETGGDLGTYRRFADEQMPFVLVNGADTGLDVPHVWADEAIAARRAVEHLASLGHERIGCVLGSGRYVTTSRFIDGFTAALAGADLERRADDVVGTSFTLEGGRAGAHRLLGQGITGILCANDLMALGAIQAVERSGRTVPADVSVIGYDGTDMTATTSPPLTTLRQPFADMGDIIADALVSEIDGTCRFRDRYVFEPELVVRGSTGPPRTGSDPRLEHALRDKKATAH